jgi:hypothetical protein
MQLTTMRTLDVGSTTTRTEVQGTFRGPLLAITRIIYIVYLASCYTSTVLGYSSSRLTEYLYLQYWEYGQVLIR